MGGEELAVGLRGRELPGDVLDAVLADVEVEPVRVVRPGAARTVEAAVLVVHHEERAKALQRLPGPFEYLRNAARRTPARGGVVVLVARVVAPGCRAAAERGHAWHCAEPPLLRVLALVRW